MRPHAIPLHPALSFPKATGFLDKIADIHGFLQKISFYLNRLAENQAYNNRQNYLMII
jgi:hypothetical protein